MNEKVHNYFYKITNLINGKYYYGIHSTNNLNDGYKGGGTLLKKSIKKHGWENFTKEIIADYLTRQEASDHEKLIVTKELIELNECYNLRTGGENDYIFTEDVLLKISESQSGEKNHFYGKKHSEDALKKMSNTHKGKKISEDQKKLVSESMCGDKSCWYGIPKSAEVKAKISNTLKMKYKSGEYKHPQLGKSLSDEQKKIIQKSTIKVRCIIFNVIYDSLVSASKVYNITPEAVSHRLKSLNFPDWIFIEKYKESDTCS